MTDNKLYKLLDLIEEINAIQSLIELHKNDDSDFMLSQYNAKKLKLTSVLINELLSPSEKSTESMIVIKSVLDKFYNSKESLNLDDDQSKRYERLLVSLAS